MAEKEKKKKTSRANTVKVVGYLKENNLEEITNSRGDRVVRGTLILATDKINSHKVQYYVAETTSAGEKSKDFESMHDLLPENTITIASFLKENPDADFDTAANAASKIWTIARFEEFASRSGERVRSIPTLKGFRAGFAKAEKAPFTTCAEFEVDIYINDMSDEVADGENGEKTGRVLIEGLIPRYDKSVDKIDFVAVTEDGVAEYIRKNYKIGDTVRINGDVVNLSERQVVESDDDDSAHFGRASSSAPQYETKFIHERRVCGGSKKPLSEDDSAYISTELVKDGLANREIKMAENGAKAAAKAQATPNDTEEAKPAAPAVVNEELDF